MNPDFTLDSILNVAKEMTNLEDFGNDSSSLFWFVE
jgi:hypothetical protein